MSTTIFCCGFEPGVDLAQGSIVGAASFDTSTFRSGFRALQCNAAGAAAYLYKIFSADSNIKVMSFYVRFSTLPNGNTYIFPMSLIGQLAGLYFQQSDNTLRTKGSSSPVGGSGIVVTTGQWYHIDILINSSANTWTIDGRVNQVALGQATHAAGAPASDNDFFMGIADNVTCLAHFDDVLISNTVGDYPLGPIEIHRLIPTSDGTHTSTGTNIVKGTTATPVGTAITVATTDAYQWVDDVPLGADGNFHNCQTPAATEYTEVQFEDSARIDAPIAIEVITADHSATFGSVANISLRLYDAVGTTEDVVTARGNSDNNVRYNSKHYAVRPAALGAWTINALNALRFRAGFSSDAIPDMYFDGVMIEAVFQDSSLLQGVLSRTKRGCGL